MARQVRWRLKRTYAPLSEDALPSSIWSTSAKNRSRRELVYAAVGTPVHAERLSGVVIAYLFGANYLIGAMVAAIVVSSLIGLASSHTRINNDTAIGVFFVG